MNLFAASPDWLLWLLAGLLLAATVHDAVQLRISNLISGLVFVLAIVAAVLAGPSLALWQNAVVFALVLGFGTLLFARGMMGGGDVKLFAAVALWADFLTGLRLVAAILLCGGVLALMIVFLRTMVPERAARRVRTLQPGAGIPYGIAIAAGALIVALYWSAEPVRPDPTSLPLPQLSTRPG